MKPEYRSSEHAIANLLVPTPSGQQVPIAELATIHQGNGASFIYRENNSRYIGVPFSVEGRDLARALDEAQKPSSRPSNCRRATASTGAVNTANTSPRLGSSLWVPNRVTRRGVLIVRIADLYAVARIFGPL